MMEPRIDEARLARQWSAIAERLDQRKRGGLRWVAFAAAAAVVLLGLGLGWKKWQAGPASVAVQNTPTSLALPDGSRVRLAPDAHVSVRTASIERIEITVETGKAEFDVTHVEGRSFVVRAATYEVIVVGTKFSVALEGASHVTVAVEQGRVRVRSDAGDERSLGAGETWSARDATPSIPSAGAVETVEPPSPPPPSPSAIAPAPKVESPKELLARAMAARSEGRPREAAALLDTIRKKHRSDARAGLAAFELGRIRLDSLGDAEGAASAFSDAMALSPDAPFREDAEARLVEALERTGDRVRCAKAKAAYQSHHPNGLHGKQVASRCSGP